MQTQCRCQLRGKGFIHALGHLHAGIADRNSGRLQHGGAISPGGQCFAVPERLLQQHDQLDVAARRRPARNYECIELDGSRCGQRTVGGDLAPPGVQDAANRGDHQRGDTEALGRLDQCGDAGEV